MSIAAAKRMRTAVKKANTVFQLGHQGRELPATAEAGRLIKDGRIGPVTVINTGRFFNGTKERAPWRWYGYYNHWDRPDPKEVIQQLDWPQWLGSAPQIEFNERHFWHWRCYWPYGTGQAGDLLSHELDHVQTVLGWGIAAPWCGSSREQRASPTDGHLAAHDGPRPGLASDSRRRRSEVPAAWVAELRSNPSAGLRRLMLLAVVARCAIEGPPERFVKPAERPKA